MAVFEQPFFLGVPLGSSIPCLLKLFPVLGAGFRL